MKMKSEYDSKFEDRDKPKCPYCGFEQTRPIDFDNRQIFTVSSCEKCNKRFEGFISLIASYTTYYPEIE